MMRLVSIRRLFVAALIAVVPLAAHAATPIVLIVVEGLRPEFVTKKDMPALHRISKDGLFSNSHHAVYPALDSVNGASLATGAYPSRHGIVGDVFVDPESGDVIAAAAALLDVPSLGEVLDEHGKRVQVIGGPRAVAQYFTGTRTDLVLSSTPTSVADTYLRAVHEASVDLAIIWFGGADGSPTSLVDVHDVDEQLARIFARHRSRGDRANVFVTSSHGVVSGVGAAVDLSTRLVAHGLKASADSPDVRVLGGNAIYVENHDRRRIGEIASWLQRQPWAGAIFTQQARPTHPEGFVRGVLSFQAVYMDHPRRPDVLVEGAWSADDDGRGVARRIGTSRPATSSLHSIEVPFIAVGPDIKKRATSDVPSAHYDLAPTIYHLLGIEIPSFVDGRVLREILRGGPKPGEVPVLRRRHGSEARWDGGGYRIIMQESTVDGVEYLDHIAVEKL